ncbi:MAG TPA: hypothetical protein VEY92_12590, partial [Pseudoxanthomonas sp.]|nr:hypothetical protein [Pseudoxanthomonas sp.]
CATGTKPTLAPAPPSPPPAPPANLVQPCPPLPPATSANPLAILAQHDKEVALYHDCRSANARLIETVHEWRATAWSWYCKAAAAVDSKPNGCANE